MQNRQHYPMSAAEAESWLSMRSAYVSPAQHDALIAAWTASTKQLAALIRGSDSLRALAAIEQVKERGEAGRTSETIAALKDCLATTTKPRVRERAALVLGHAGERSAIPVLRRMLTQRESDPTAERGAVNQALQGAWILVRLQDRASYPAIRGLSTRLDFTEKRHLADLLAVMNSLEDRALIRRLLTEKHSYPGTRAHAAKALGIAKDKSAVPLLIAALKDPYGDVRRGAAEALGMLRDPRALPALRKAMGAQNGTNVPAHNPQPAQEAARQAVAAILSDGKRTILQTALPR